MKFIVSSATLRSAVAFISRVVQPNPIVPILTDIVFRLDANTLTLRASNIQSTLTTTIEVEGQLVQEGAFTVPAHKLTQLLGNLTDQPLTIVVDTERFGTKISWDAGKTSLTGENPLDFPRLPVSKEKTITVTLDEDQTSDLLAGLSATVYACSTNDLRPAMTGVYLHQTAHGLTLVSTNGHLLCRQVVGGQVPQNLPGCIIPANFVRLLLKSGVSGGLSLDFTGTNLTIEAAGHQLITRLIDERFPDYESAVPVNQDKVLTIGRDEFIHALKLALLTANATTKQVRLSLDAEGCTLHGEDLDYSHETDQTLAASYEGDPIEIGFKGGMLMQALSHTVGNTLRLEMSVPNRAALLYGANEGGMTLVMPVMLNTYA